MSGAFKTEGVRSFIAVPLPPEVQAEIFQAAVTLAPALPEVKWSRKVENLHITLKFLGDVAEDRLAALGTALVEALRDLPPFSLEMRGFGGFPSLRQAHVLWAGVSDPEQGLSRLAALVEQVGARFGFAAEDRAFHGHVTVGRSRRSVDVQRALAPFTDRSFGQVSVGAVHVYESQLGQGGEGSTYVLRCRVTLGTNRALSH